MNILQKIISRSRSSLRIRSLLVSLSILLLLTFLGIASLYSNYRMREQDVVQHNLDLTKSATILINEWVNGNIRALRAITLSRFMNISNINDINSDFITFYLTKQPDWKGIAIFNPSGHAIVSTLTNDSFISDDDFFLRTKRNLAGTVSNLKIDPVTHKRYLIITYPITKKGVLKGILAVYLSPHEIVRLLGKLTKNEATFISLWGNDQNLIASSKTGMEKLAEPFQYKDSRNIFSGRHGTIKLFDTTSNTKQVLGYAPIPSYFLTVMTMTPLSSVHYQVARDMEPFFLITLVIVIVSSSLLFLSAATISKHLDTLMKGAQSIENDKYEGTLTIKSTRELENMAKALNAIALKCDHHNRIMRGLMHEKSSQSELLDKALSSFNQSLAHLKSPLRRIKAVSNILLSEYSRGLDEHGKKYLTRMGSAAHYLTRATDDLLLLAHISRSKLNYRELNLSSIATKIVNELKKAHPVSTTQFYIQEKLIAHGDNHLIKIMLANLLVNAWKFSSKNQLAHIEFGANDTEGKTIYFVKDNGIGFDMAYASKLFTPFQRLHRKEEFPGTGIGLTIVHHILQRLDGEIWVESSVNQGTTFYFTLPAH